MFLCDWFWFSFWLVDKLARDFSTIIVWAVFKWLSKVTTRLQLLRLVIGLKILRQFINQWGRQPKPFATCTRLACAIFTALFMELLQIWIGSVRYLHLVYYFYKILLKNNSTNEGNCCFFNFLIETNFLDTRSHFLPANKNARLTTHNQSKFVWCHGRVYIITLI